MSWVHNIVYMQRTVVETGCEQVGAQIVSLCRIIACLLSSTDACQKSCWVVKHSFERSFASSLLLRAILIYYTRRLPNIMSNLSLVLEFVIKLVEGSLAHENKLIARFISIEKCSRQLSWWLFSFQVGLGKPSLMKMLENIELLLFAIHCDFVLFVAHLIEFFVSQLAFTLWSDHSSWPPWLIFHNWLDFVN